MELREKHGEQYDLRQLQLWARMKLNGQHTSLEHPPCISFFSGANVKPAKRESLSDALTSAATAVVHRRYYVSRETCSSFRPIPGAIGKTSKITGVRCANCFRV